MMALIPRILGGNYGDGTFGIKTSLPGYDVSVLADDNDVTKRSFNSQWTNLAKIKIIGVAVAEWVQYQEQGGYTDPPNGTRLFSNSGWRVASPIIVPTGLSYIPVWEERLFDPGVGYFYDDHVVVTTPNSGQASQSGGRSYHSGPAISPANSLFISPHIANENYAPVINSNYYFWNPIGDFPGYPAYPEYPAKPTKSLASAYVIYSNKMGDVT